MTPEQALARLQRDGGKLEAAALRRVLRAFRDADTRSLIAQLAAAMLGSNPSERLRARERLLALADALFPPLPDDLLALTRQAVTLGAEVGAGMVPVAAPFVAPAVAEAAGEAAQRLQAYWGDNRRAYAARVGGIITRALQSGGRYPVRADIQKALNTSRHHAQTIALTETSAALSAGQSRVIERAAEQTDAQVVKIWVAARDPRTRASHARLNGEERPLDKPFSNGLMRPHDPSGKAAEVIRCRCTMKYVLKD